MAERDILLLLTPLGGLAVAALAQVAHYRWKRSMSRSYLAALAAGLLAVPAASFVLRGQDPVEDFGLALLNIGCFLGLWLNLVAVVGLGVSLRLRIMDFLSRAGAPQSEQALFERFGARAQVNRRLDGLLAGGHIREENGRLVSTGTWMTRMALLNAAIKHFLVGSTSEFGTRGRP